MSTPALQSERIARTVQQVIAAGWDAARAEVEADWLEAGAPLAIPDPAGYGFGFKETIQTFAATEFPYISVLAAAVAPTQEGSDQGWSQATHQLMIEAVVHVGATDTDEPAPIDEAMVLAWRVAEVLATTLRRADLAPFELASLVPTTFEGQPLSHRPTKGGGRFTGWVCGRVLQYQVTAEYAL